MARMIDLIDKSADELQAMAAERSDPDIREAASFKARLEGEWGDKEDWWLSSLGHDLFGSLSRIEECLLSHEASKRRNALKRRYMEARRVHFIILALLLTAGVAGGMAFLGLTILTGG